MSEQRTFQPTQNDYNRAQMILDQLVVLYRELSKNGGSTIPELTVGIASDEDLKAYAILQHSGHGTCSQTHTGWSFSYRPKGATVGAPIRPHDPFRAALGDLSNRTDPRRAGFWEIFEKTRNGGG